MNIYIHHCHRTDVNLVVGACPRPCAVDVLKPSWRITATRSAFCTGFAMYAAKTSRSSVASMPLYALTAMIGVVVFLLCLDADEDIACLVRGAHQGALGGVGVLVEALSGLRLASR